MSWIHWAVVLLIVLLVFGTKRLRGAGKDLGEAVKGFKDGMKDDKPNGQLGDDSARSKESSESKERDRDAH